MLEQFTIDTFAPLEGQAFRLHVEGVPPVEMRLQSVKEIPVTGWRPDDAAEHRTPFSLVFVCRSQFVLQQAIYRFEHDEIGAFEIFIVPISRSAEGVSYEVVFS
jgi:hypothetical protein